MPQRKKKSPAAQAAQAEEELAEQIDEETSERELERLERKIAREERKKRREIESAKQKKAIWVLPTLLLTTMLISWLLNNLEF